MKIVSSFPKHFLQISKSFQKIELALYKSPRIQKFRFRFWLNPYLIKKYVSQYFWKSWINKNQIDFSSKILIKKNFPKPLFWEGPNNFKWKWKLFVVFQNILYKFPKSFQKIEVAAKPSPPPKPLNISK